MKTLKLKTSKIFYTIVLAALIVFVVVISYAVPNAHAQLSSNAQGLAGLIAVNNIVGNNGGALTSTNSLGDLIVLSGLFPTSTNASQNAKNLAGLIAVNNVTGGGTGGALTNNTNSLGSLIVLNGLFGGTGTSASTMAKNLAGLIAVNNVTGGGTGGALTGGGVDNLGSLIVLNGLFMDP